MRKVGYWAGKHRMLRKALQYAKEVQIGVIGVILGIIVLWVAFALIRRRMRRNQAPNLSALPGGRAAQPRRAAGDRTEA